MVEQKSISDLTITELKALGWDELSKLELAQVNIRTINAEIQKRLSVVEVSKSE